jgi:hypothetical protein
MFSVLHFSDKLLYKKLFSMSNVGPILKYGTKSKIVFFIESHDILVLYELEVGNWCFTGLLFLFCNVIIWEPWKLSMWHGCGSAVWGNVIPGRGKSVYSCAEFIYVLWGPINLLSSMYQGLFQTSDWVTKLTTHVCLLWRLECMELYFCSSACLRGLCRDNFYLYGYHIL